MKWKLFKSRNKGKAHPIPLKTSVLVGLAFAFLLWVLGRIMLVAHYGWTFEVILFLDLWLFPLLDVVRDIAKEAGNKQKGTGHPEKCRGRL